MWTMVLVVALSGILYQASGSGVYYKDEATCRAGLAAERQRLVEYIKTHPTPADVTAFIDCYTNDTLFMDGMKLEDVGKQRIQPDVDPEGHYHVEPNHPMGSDDGTK